MADLLGRRRVFMAGLLLFAVASLAGGFAANRGPADRRPRGAGPRRGDPLPRRALDRHHHLPRRRRAQQGARRLGRGRRLRRRRRRAARRHPHRRPRLGVGALGQRAGRPDRRRARAAADRREPLRVDDARTSTSPARSPSPPASRSSSTRSSTPTTPAGARPRRSACSALSAALLAAFVAIELRSQAPLVPFRIFRIRTLTGANVVGLLVGASLFSMFFFISLYMQQVLGYSAIHAGPLLPAAGADDHRRGRHRLAARHAGSASSRCSPPGWLFIAAGLLWFAPGLGRRRLHSPTSSARRCSPRSGSASRFVTTTIAAVSGRRASARPGLASGLINTSQQIGGALGLAVLATIANSRTDDVHRPSGDLGAAERAHRGLPGRLPRRRRVRRARLRADAGPDPQPRQPRPRRHGERRGCTGLRARPARGYPCGARPRRAIWGYSSVGRAPGSQSGGRRFEPG